MVETRIAPRYRVMKVAKIEFGVAAIDCTVRDLSLTGAAIAVPSQAEIPERFTLFMPEDGLQLHCHVVWRREYQIGVAFD